jgi:hypothetical protein
MLFDAGTIAVLGLLALALGVVAYLALTSPG